MFPTLFSNLKFYVWLGGMYNRNLSYLLLFFLEYLSPILSLQVDFISE